MRQFPRPVKRHIPGRSVVTILSMVMVFFALQFPCWGAGTASVTLVPGVGGSYSLQAGGFSGVAGVDVTIFYDTSILSSPRVLQGSMLNGAMFSSNPNNPGIIRIAILHATGGIAGSGQLAAITFDRMAVAGGINGVAATIIDKTGARMAVSSTFTNPTEQTATAGTTPTETASPSAGTSSTTTTGPAPLNEPTGTVSGLTVSMPTDGGTTQEKPGAAARTPETIPAPPSADSREGQATPEEPAAEETVSKEKATPAKKLVTEQAVLDKFRAFTGELTPANLTGLFDPAKDLSYHQDPPVVLTDGKQHLKIVVMLDGQAKTAPNFALENASIKSLKRGEQGEWVIEALPKKGSETALLTLFYDGNSAEIPLTVAPLLSASQLGVLKGLTDADLAQFLKERGTPTAPKFDLNHDGKRDYQDDYLFVANYLAKKDTPVHPAAKTK